MQLRLGREICFPHATGTSVIQRCPHRCQALGDSHIGTVPTLITVCAKVMAGSEPEQPNQQVRSSRPRKPSEPRLEHKLS